MMMMMVMMMMVMMVSIMSIYQAREESKRRSSSTAWHRGKTRHGGWGETRPERNSMTAIMMIMILNINIVA